MIFQEGVLQNFMGQRKAWSKEEDAALMQIIQVQKIRKWSAVSRTMEAEFKIVGRTGKQCRERWHNQLDPSIKRSQWTHEQERILFQLHTQFGNRWAKISEELEGRTDNCVKNHFYSTLRRGFRKMNKYIADNRHIEGLKQLKPVMLSKLVAAAEDKYDKKLKLSDEVIQKSIELKNLLIPLSQEGEDTPVDQKGVEGLIREIIAFCRSYKRKKGKKAKKSHEDYGYPEVEEREEEQWNSIGQQEESVPTKSNEKVPPQHTDLFNLNKACLLKPETPPLLLTKQSVISNSLRHKGRSKIIQQDNPYQPMNRRSSNLSNFSAMFKIPSMQQNISNLSLSNQLNFQTFNYGGYILDASFNLGHKNLFGVQISNFNDFA